VIIVITLNNNIYFSKDLEDRQSLNAVMRGSFLIEIEQVANNTLNADVCFSMKELVRLLE